MSDESAPRWTRFSPSNDAPQFPRRASDPPWVPFVERKRWVNGRAFVRFADLPEFESRRLWLYNKHLAFEHDGRICLWWDEYLLMIGEKD